MQTLLLRSAMVGLLLSALLLIGSAGVARADPIAPGVEHCVINVRTDDALNMRERPSASARIVTRKRYAECGITVTGPCSGAWCPVEDGHWAGWVHRRYIAAVSPARYCVVNVARGDRLNIRAYPSPQSRVLTRLAPNHCGVAFLPYSVGNWQKIRVNGWEGWAHRRYLSGQ